MGEEAGPDGDAAVCEGGGGDTVAGIGGGEDADEVVDGREVLVAHGDHEHLVCPWRVGGLCLGAWGGDSGVGGGDVQVLEEGAEGGAVVGRAGHGEIILCGLGTVGLREVATFLLGQR